MDQGNPSSSRILQHPVRFDIRKTHHLRGLPNSLPSPDKPRTAEPTRTVETHLRRDHPHIFMQSVRLDTLGQPRTTTCIREQVHIDIVRQLFAPKIRSGIQVGQKGVTVDGDDRNAEHCIKQI